MLFPLSPGGRTNKAAKGTAAEQWSIAVHNTPTIASRTPAASAPPVVPDQLKLVTLIAREGEAPAEPLTDEELAAEALQAAADAAELAQARQRSREWAESEVEHRPTSDPVGWAPPTTPPDPSTTPETSPGATAGSSSSAPDTPPSTPYSVPSTLPGTTHHSPTHDSPAPVHNLHTENNTQIAATADQPCTCMREPAAEENSPATCIIECAPTHAGVSLSHQTAPRIAEPLSY